MDMIERVSRALRQADYEDETLDDQMLPLSAYKRQARAAIKAMREPTQEMLDAGTNAGLPGYDYAPPDTTYPAMIDAALKCSTKQTEK